jgi:hypothetical protein
MTQVSEQWVPMNVAARELGVSPTKLSNMAQAGQIETRHDLRDNRKRLVDLVALRKLFGVAPK